MQLISRLGKSLLSYFMGLLHNPKLVLCVNEKQKGKFTAEIAWVSFCDTALLIGKAKACMLNAVKGV